MRIKMTITVIIALISISTYLIISNMNKKHERIILELKSQNDWLFKSLYSINNKVLLPDEVEPKIERKKAVIHSPKKKGMIEFTGGLDDFH